jgi:hypothetical protein
MNGHVLQIIMLYRWACCVSSGLWPRYKADCFAGIVVSIPAEGTGVCLICCLVKVYAMDRSTPKLVTHYNGLVHTV